MYNYSYVTRMSAFDPDIMNHTGHAIARPFRWLLSWFTAHPTEKGVTYGQHLRRAWYMAWQMGYGSFCLFIHGVFPAWFPTVGSITIKRLYLDVRGEEEKVKKEEVDKQV